MPLYRCLTNVRYGKEILPEGSIQHFRISSSAEKILVKKKAISRVLCPPLDRLWGVDEETLTWLDRLGVRDGHSLFDFDARSFPEQSRRDLDRIKETLMIFVEVT